MENLPRDVLITLALELDFPSILAFCTTNKRINEKVCLNDKFWLTKLRRDYSKELPYFSTFNLSNIETYKLLSSLDKVKQAFKLEESSLEELYLGEYIYMWDKGINKIPKEIEVLTNLKELDLEKNNISEIPKEIGKLKNLKVLNLDSNNISKIPKEIGNLSNLTRLQLQGNWITKIPEELDKLPKLELLDISGNPILEKEIPEALKRNKKLAIISR